MQEIGKEYIEGMLFHLRITHRQKLFERREQGGERLRGESRDLTHVARTERRWRMTVN